jgi:hypothetical protein
MSSYMYMRGRYAVTEEAMRPVCTLPGSRYGYNVGVGLLLFGGGGEGVRVRVRE